MEKPSSLPRPRPVVECFEGLPGPRRDRTRRHKLTDILVIGLCSTMTAGEGFTDMECFGSAHEEWFRTFLELPNGIPSRDTFNRVFSAIDARRYWHATDIHWFADRKLWKGLTSAGMVEPERTVNGKRSVERRYCLSSLPLGAETFARAVRGHWSVENNLHWSLDVTFGEDQSRARTRHAAQNLATLRRLALNLVKKDKTRKLPLRQKRILAAMNYGYLKHLLGV